MNQAHRWIGYAKWFGVGTRSFGAVLALGNYTILRLFVQELQNCSTKPAQSEVVILVKSLRKSGECMNSCTLPLALHNSSSIKSSGHCKQRLPERAKLALCIERAIGTYRSTLAVPSWPSCLFGFAFCSLGKMALESTEGTAKTSWRREWKNIKK